MSRRPTLADVARLAGVSPSTASVVYSGAAAVSESTRERVLAAAAELGYAGPDPRAASLRRGRSGIVGVVIGGDLRSAFLDPVLSATLDGMADVLADADSDLLLLRGDARSASLSTAPVDSVVVIGCEPTAAADLETLRARGVPMVVIEGDAGEDIPQVLLDSADAQRAIAQYVADLGHRDVALVTLPLTAGVTTGVAGAAASVFASVAVTRDRLAGARDVFPEATVVSSARSTIDEGIAAGRLLFAGDHPPTAVLAQSDLLAAGVVRAAEEAGLRVPEDVSVAGFDGVAVDGIAPHVLTTMVQPAFEKGRATAQMLMQLEAGEPTASRRFTSTFRKGTTTAPPRG